MQHEHEQDDELAELEYLWDGSQNWGLSVHHLSQASLTLVFESARPSVREIMALRKLIVEHRHTPPGELRDALGDSGRLSLGTFDSMEAHELSRAAAKLGLAIESVDASRTGYFPINIDDSTGLIVEDEELWQRAAKKMLEAGAAIVSFSEEG